MQYNTIIERGAHKMGLMTFKGGVHPFEGKDLSKDKPIRELLPKGELVYPLSQQQAALYLHQSMRPYPELLRKLSQEEFQQVIW